MSDSPASGSLSDYKLRDSKSTAIISKVLIAIIFFLFLTVTFFVFLHLYSKWVLRRTGNSRSRRLRFAYATERDVPHSGLDPSLLRSLPVLVFKSAEFKEGLECAVCLSDVSEGEKARLLPKCSHGFHLECIDMWFQSHSTCPICRNPVASESSSQNSGDSEVLEVNSAPEMPNLPTNVLFWGAQNQVNTTRVEEGTSSSSNKEENRNQQIEIQIPRRLLTEGFSLPSPSPSSARRTENDMKSPVSRLRSLKRLLSGEKRIALPSSSKGEDVSMV